MKTLILDIENTPLLGYTWGVHEVDVIKVVKHSHLLCYAFSWLDGETDCHAICDFPNYRAGDDDSQILPLLWKLLDEADIIVGQNIDRFDLPKINARFVLAGIKPPSPYKTVDTLKVSRNRFGFPSNKLNDVCSAMDIGEKVVHTGFDLWERCMAGDMEAWKLMKEYNKRDVDLTKELYLRQLPWIKNHPNMLGGCPNCGSDAIQARGWQINARGKYRRFQCQDCGNWFTDRIKQITEPLQKIYYNI